MPSEQQLNHKLQWHTPASSHLQVFARSNHRFFHHIISFWGLGEGVQVRDHSFRAVICNKLKEEAREVGHILGERLKEPNEIKSFSQSFSNSITSQDGVNLNFSCFRGIRKGGITFSVLSKCILIRPEFLAISLPDVASTGISD